MSRCQPCACDPVGSVSSSCHPDTGVCVCKLLVTGDKCDSCQPAASHFDPENHFGCSKGVFYVLINTRHKHIGWTEVNLYFVLNSVPLCKTIRLIQTVSFSHFNCLYFYLFPFTLFVGAAPSQQPAPIGLALSYSAIRLSWHPPDSPNSHRLNYTVIRDGKSVHTVRGHYPFSMY